MKKKIQVTESILQRMIAKALNESLGNEGINPYKAIDNWVIAVSNGADAQHCREFRDFYLTIMNHRGAKQAVIAGIASESKNQSGYLYRENNPEMFKKKISPTEWQYINDMGQGTIDKTLVPDKEEHLDDLEKNKEFTITKDNHTETGQTEDNDNFVPRNPPLRILDLIENTNIHEDIISEFLLGVNCLAKETSEPDALSGRNIETLIHRRLGPNGSIQSFIGTLFTMIKYYSGHYVRKQYNDLVMHYGVNSKSIGGDRSNAIQDDNDGDSVSADYELKQGGNDNRYYEKMKELVEKILSDKSIGLGPQERTLLQTLLNVSREPMDPERLEQMQGLSDKQQQMMVYQVMSEKTGIPVDKIQRSLSAAIQKAKQSKYAKQLAEKKQQLSKKIINEVMRIIIKDYVNKI